MIYFFGGSDAAKARAKAFAWVAAARKKAPDAPYLRVSAEDVTPHTLQEVTGTQGLFFSKTLALLDDPFSLKDAGELVIESLSALAASENPIAIVAPKLIAARQKKIEAKAEKVFIINAKEKAEGRGFNGALVNALGAKDGAALWQEIIKAYRLGDAPEAVHGLLHWKARDMMQKGNAKWGKDGARTLSVELIELLSDARSGELPLKESLERFALTI